MFNDLIYRITFRCDKKCYFCYNDVFDETVNYEENEEKYIEKLVNFIEKNKIKRISISGGEPSVRADLPNLIKELNKVTTIKIFTNGNLFYKYTLDELLSFNFAKIVYTVTDADIYGNEQFIKTVEIIQKLRKNGISVDGNMFLDSNYFKKREKIIEQKLYDKFDNIRWQPLILPKSFNNFKITINGMDKEKRKEIFKSVIEDNWGNVKDYYKIFDEWLDNNGLQPYPCLFPKTTCTVDPDLSVKICPHQNTKNYTFENIEEDVKNKTFDDCLCSQCLSIYKFK